MFHHLAYSLSKQKVSLHVINGEVSLNRELVHTVTIYSTTLLQVTVITVTKEEVMAALVLRAAAR